MSDNDKGTIPGYLEGFSDGRIFQIRELITALSQARNEIPSDLCNPREVFDVIIDLMTNELPSEGEEAGSDKVFTVRGVEHSFRQGD